MAKQKKNNGKLAAEIGAGVAVAAAAAAAGYYFYGAKDAKQHRKAAAAWAHEMKKDVVREAKKAQRLEAKDIARIVDSAAAAYQGVRSIDRKDLNKAAEELKRNWELVKQEAKKTARASTKSAQKSAKRVAKSTKKSAAKAKAVARKRTSR